MATSVLAPLQQILTSSGALGSGLKLFVYVPGTTTKLNTYPTAADADAATNANTNPVVLNARGEPTSGGIWVPDSIADGAVKLVLALSTDSDPPTSPIRTQDNFRLFDASVVDDIDTINENQRTKGIYKIPSSLGHYIGSNIFYRKRKDGSAELINDLSAYYPSGAFAPLSDPALTVYYVDPVNGDDSYSGVNWSNALKGVDVALAKSDVDVVAIKGGTTIRVGDHMGTYSGTRDIVMVGVGERVRMTTASGNAWSATGGATPNVYEQTSGGTVVMVADARSIDSTGWYSRLTNVASIALVNSTPGSWFYDSGAGKTYIRLSDDADPSSATIAADVFALRASPMRVDANDIKFYMGNIHFIGGSGGAFSARDATANTVVIAEDCLFSHMYNSDAVDIADIGLFVAIRCGAGGSFEDGFSYRELNGLSPDFIEVDCWSTGNYGDDTSNGSTAHNSVRGIRLNCDYGFNTGPGVADVNSSKTYNVNITSRNNTGSSNAGGVQATGTAEVWYDGLAASDNQAQDARAADTSTFHYRDMWIEDVDVDNEDGTSTIDQNFS
jgi:hypothetical protein